MADYEYSCGMCEKAITISRPITDQLSRDPYCESCMIPMKRVYSATPAIFKGKGWGGSK